MCKPYTLATFMECAQVNLYFTNELDGCLVFTGDLPSPFEIIQKAMIDLRATIRIVMK